MNRLRSISIVLSDTAEELRLAAAFPDCNCWIAATPDFIPDSGRVIFFFCGHGGKPDSNNLCRTDRPSGDWLRRELLRRGFMLVCPYCGPGSWGCAETSELSVRCTKRLREYGIAVPEKLPLLGFSMGGLAALMLGIRHPERVSRIVDVFGITDLDLLWRDTANPDYRSEIGNLWPTAEERRNDSPLYHAEELSRLPLRIYHGSADRTIPPEHSTRLFRALSGYGADCRLRLVEGVGHEMRIVDHIGDEIADFLEKGE